jgi:actin-related protein
MFGTTKITLRHKARKNKQLNFYKTMALPFLMYGRGKWTQDEKLKEDLSNTDEVCAAYSRLCSGTRKRSNEIRSQLWTRKFDKQIHKEGRKTGCNINRGYHHKELPGNCHIMNRQEVVVQEDQKEVGFKAERDNSSTLADDDYYYYFEHMQDFKYRGCI